MPNGRHEWFTEELPGLEQFFSTIAPVLIAYSTEHGLLIDKYWHQTPTWWLCFSHPRGGWAHVDVERAGTGQVEIHGCWWIDDRAAGTRYGRVRDPVRCATEPSELRAALECALAEVAAWEPGAWSGVKTGFAEWAALTEEEFLRREPNWPRPRL